MELIEPTIEYCQQILTYRKEFLDCGDSMDGTGGLRAFDQPSVWIEKTNRYKDPLTVPRERFRQHSIYLCGKRIGKSSV